MRLNDIKSVWERVNFVKELCGATAEFQDEYASRWGKLTAAIRKETGVSSVEEAAATPLETELKSEEVQTAHREFCQWIAGQHPAFKDLEA